MSEIESGGCSIFRSDKILKGYMWLYMAAFLVASRQNQGKLDILPLLLKYS